MSYKKVSRKEVNLKWKKGKHKHKLKNQWNRKQTLDESKKAKTGCLKLSTIGQKEICASPISGMKEDYYYIPYRH